MKRAAWRAAAAAGLATAAGFALVLVPAAVAEPEVLGTDAPGIISGSYLVVLKEAASTQSVQDLAAQHGATVTFRYTKALNGFAAKMDAAQAQVLAKDPAVASVEQDRVVSIAGTQPNPPSWGLDRIDQRDLPLNSSYTDGGTGAGVTAYIIDTGIRTTHTDFGTRATWGANFAGGAATDCNGHGTHVAGTVGGTAYGVAKQVSLVAVKVLDCNGSGTLAGVAAGVDWVTANAVKPAVANMSLGATGANATLESAVRNSIASGVTYALASGNSNADACNFTPARVAEAITVNASTNTDARASFSNFGSCTDVFAPGQNIVSAWNTNDTATNNISGTSMASPHVAGAAASYLTKYPNATPPQVQAALKAAATPGKITSPGAGSPNALLYVGEGQPPTDPPTTTTTTPQPPTCTVPAWSATEFYFLGAQVSYSGTVYFLATFFSYGQPPGSITAWIALGPC